MSVSLPAQSLISLEPCPISTSANSLQLPLVFLFPSLAKPKWYFIILSSLFHPVDFSYQNEGSNRCWRHACTAPYLDTGPNRALISTGGSVQYYGYILYQSTDPQLCLKCLNSTQLGYFYTAQKHEARQPNSEQSRHMLSVPFSLEKTALINYRCHSPWEAAESSPALRCTRNHKLHLAERVSTSPVLLPSQYWCFQIDIIANKHIATSVGHPSSSSTSLFQNLFIHHAFRSLLSCFNCHDSWIYSTALLQHNSHPTVILHLANK